MRDPAPITIAETATLRDALAAINRDVIGTALVVDGEGRFVGVISDGDARRALLSGATLETPASQLVNRAAVFAGADAEPSVLFTLVNERIRHVPLLDRQRRPVGVFSYEHRFRVPVAEPSLGEQERALVLECLDSGWISSSGPMVARFEADFAAAIGVKHALAVCNGTMALWLALDALGIGDGDEVLVPALTFAATAAVVLHRRATPVFVDVDPDDWNLDLNAAERACTAKTRAIIPVHLYGQPCDMAAIGDFARKRGLFVIEDAAEATGARLGDRLVGGFGHAGAFSFFANKILTTGEGGMITTDDPALCERLRLLRDHGMRPERRYWHEVPGYNARLTNLQAALGVAQLSRLDALVARKRAGHLRYRQRLDGTPGLRFQHEAPGTSSACWMTTIVLDPPFDERLPILIAVLQEHGVETRPMFWPLHEMPAFQGARCGPFVTADVEDRRGVAPGLAHRGLTLPSSSRLQEGEIDRICALIGSALGLR